jgi:hypothetical protein
MKSFINLLNFDLRSFLLEPMPHLTTNIALREGKQWIPLSLRALWLCDTRSDRQEALLCATDMQTANEG